MGGTWRREGALNRPDGRVFKYARRSPSRVGHIVSSCLLGSTGHYVEGSGYSASLVNRKALGGKRLRMVPSRDVIGTRIAAYRVSGVALVSLRLGARIGWGMSTARTAGAGREGV
jgi:hypothetical protein